jgi:hypothetical protein
VAVVMPDWQRQCLLVFLATAVADYFWVQYMSSVSRRAPLLAAFWSSSIILVNAMAVIVYIDNHWAVLAAACGAFGGTYLSVRRVK